MSATPEPLRPLLTGGDRRSIARSDRARACVERDPRRVRELAALADDPDWLVGMRALDVLEKLAHEHPAWVQPHRRVFLGPLAESESWEIRLQIVRTLPLLRWTAAQRVRAIEILETNARDPQLFVSSWALTGLAAFAECDATLRASVLALLRSFERSSSRARPARARKIREQHAWACSGSAHAQ